MPIHFTCAQCSRAISTEVADPSKPMTCPACAAAPANDWWTTAAPVAPAYVPPLPPPPVRRAPVALLAAGGAVLFVAAAVAAVLALPSRRQTPLASVVQTDDDTVAIDKPAPVEQPQPLPPDNNNPTTETPRSEEPLPGRLTTPRLWSGPEPRQTPPEQPKVKKEEPKAKPDETKVAKVVVKRRKDVDADDLVKQLSKAPILSLDTSARRVESEYLIAAGKRAHADDSAVAHMEKRADLHGLPWLKGDACKISTTAADNLQEGSIALRAFMSDVSAANPRAFRSGGGGATERPDPKHLDDQLNKNGRNHNRWLKAEAIPALQQLLMAEDDAVREVLVDQLAKIEGKKASVALAQRALFDLHPRVRERALNALASRPVAEYRDTLLAGFSYPWPAIADHAAEALVALKMSDAAQPLLAVLDMPDPRAPYKHEKKGMVVKELVRVNHLLNCVMCHAASTKQDDKVRGRVPVTTQALPPAFSRQYYADRTGTFVRANVTYLRQDFSVPLKVEKHGLWPEVQRFDFMVRERPATVADSTAAKKTTGPTPHHQAVFFALRELTGSDPGPTAEDWKKHFLNKEIKVQAVHVGFKNARGLAQIDGTLYVSDGGAILRKEGDAKPTTWLRDASGIEALASDGKGGLLAVNAHTNAIAKVDLSLRELAALPIAQDKRLTHPRRLAADANGGLYVSADPDADVSSDKGSVHYVSKHGTVTKLSLGQLTRPRALALAHDGKTLYVASAATPDLMAYPVESAGNLGKGSRLAKVAAADVAIDKAGHVCVLDAAAQVVEILSPAGARLALAKLPDVPVACVTHEATLYVLTKKGIYRIDLTGAGMTVVKRG